jgi:hypothetical protein
MSRRSRNHRVSRPSMAVGVIIIRCCLCTGISTGEPTLEQYPRVQPKWRDDVASISPERKSHRPFGSEQSGWTRGTDIAHTCLAASIERRKAEKTPPLGATFASLLGGATMVHTLRAGWRENAQGHQANNLGMTIRPNSA